MNHHLDLRQQANGACQKLTRGQRDETDQDGLCRTIMAELDGLPIRPVGEWAYEKIYRLVQYFGIFAGGMKNRWAGLNRLGSGTLSSARRFLGDRRHRAGDRAQSSFFFFAESDLHRCQPTGDRNPEQAD